MTAQDIHAGSSHRPKALALAAECVEARPSRRLATASLGSAVIAVGSEGHGHGLGLLVVAVEEPRHGRSQEQAYWEGQFHERHPPWLGLQGPCVKVFVEEPGEL